jgi:hypothetical protein
VGRTRCGASPQVRRHELENPEDDREFDYWAQLNAVEDALAGLLSFKGQPTEAAIAILREERDALAAFSHPTSDEATSRAANQLLEAASRVLGHLDPEG